MQKSVISTRGRQRPPTTVDLNFGDGGGGGRLEDPLEEEEEEENEEQDVPKEVETTTTPVPAAITDPGISNKNVNSSHNNHRALPRTRKSNNGHRQYEAVVVGDNHRTDTINNELHDNIEEVIGSFNQELENLERSFNELASSQQSLRHSARMAVMEEEESRENNRFHANTVTTPSRGGTYNSYSFSERPSSTTAASRRDDPSTTQPQRFSTSTTTPQRGSSSMNRSGVSYYGLDSENRSTTTPYRVPPPDPVETPLLIHQHQPPPTPNIRTDWESTLDRMKETLSQQQQRIQQLERENKDLRRMLDQVGRRQPPPSPQQQQQLGGRQQPEDLASRGMTFRSTQLSTPPRDNEYQDDFDTATFWHNHRRRVEGSLENDVEFFTPGTRFVAELARLMKMEHGHHAPLSVLLDKHWDRLKYHMRDDY